MSRQSQFINSDIVSARVLNTPESAYQDLRHPITIVFRVEVWLNDNADIVIYTISLYIHFTCTFIIYRHAIPIYISYFFRIQHGIHLFNELVLHLIWAIGIKTMISHIMKNQRNVLKCLKTNSSWWNKERNIIYSKYVFYIDYVGLRFL